MKPKKCRVETQVCDEGSEEVITTKECLKPKKHKRCVVEVQQSSTTKEVVEECIKPKKYKCKEVRIDGPVKEICKKERICEPKAPKAEVICAPATRVVCAPAKK